MSQVIITKKWKQYMYRGNKTNNKVGLLCFTIFNNDNFCNVKVTDR